MPEPEGERYYYADGKKVGLTTSHRFLAVKTPEDEDDRRGAGATALSVAAEGAQILELPEYDLSVIALPDAGGTSAPAERRFDAVRGAVAAASEIASGPEVYETTEPGPEALIAIAEVIARFKDDVSEDARKRLLAKHKLTVKQADYPEPGADLLELPSDGDPVTVANELHESDVVEFAEPNFVHLTPRPEGGFENGTTMTLPEAPSLPPELLQADETALADAAASLGGPAAPPTDPGFASQWGLKKIKAPEAWDISMGTPGISVAIIDEGCDLAHEDLVYKTPGWDAYDVDNNPSPLPADGHGTSCAGIAGAKANNAKGGAGVAPKCKVFPVRIAKGIGGGFWDTTSAKVADGIRKAVDRGADVLSNSYGVGPSSVVTNAFTYAQASGRGGRGCPVAAATGNGDVLGVIYPARLSPSIRGFLAVGASNEWDQRKSKTSLDGESWWGSNYGPEVDVVAPGVHIYTTDITGAAGYGGGNYVPAFNGTSSATPHVAGLMALILSVDPELRSWEVEDIIKLTADDIAPGGRDQQTGFGRINARRALEAASRIWYQITIGLEFLGTGKECFMRANVRMFNPGINTVRLDALTLTSHNPSWTAEIDRFEYRPNPGNVLAPRSSQDVRLNRILLRANGNQAAWSYRWALNWSYTYWRPGAPGFPLDASEATESEGLAVTSQGVRGSGNSPQQPAAVPNGAGMQQTGTMPADGVAGGDLLTIDRQTREIRIVIR
jgi:thermitase